jgi:hypothetical protein
MCLINIVNKMSKLIVVHRLYCDCERLIGTKTKNVNIKSNIIFIYMILFLIYTLTGMNTFFFSYNLLYVYIIK